MRAFLFASATAATLTLRRLIRFPSQLSTEPFLRWAAQIYPAPSPATSLLRRRPPPHVVRNLSLSGQLHCRDKQAFILPMLILFHLRGPVSQLSHSCHRRNPYRDPVPVSPSSAREQSLTPPFRALSSMIWVDPDWGYRQFRVNFGGSGARTGSQQGEATERLSRNRRMHRSLFDKDF